MLNTPVLFLIFNRPDVTRVVFESIRKAKPRYLYVAADGPRSTKEGEKEKCELTRKIIQEGVDWECELKVLFRDENLGCKYAVSGAINWFFENVEEGIILEDDCLPDNSFFTYCSELLEKYRNNPSVMHISSNNFNNTQAGKASYYFSNYLEIWGWATWRRAWKLYDPEISNFQEMKKKNFLDTVFKTREEKDYWLSCFEDANRKGLDTWDYQWVFCVYSNSGKAITPYVNLVSNLGFGNDATHTTTYHSVFSNMVAQNLKEIIHPEETKINWKEDNQTFRNIYKTKESFVKNFIKGNKLLYGLFKRLKRIID